MAKTKVVQKNANRRRSETKGSVWSRRGTEFVEFDCNNQIIFFRRHNVFYRVWLNSRTLKLTPLFWPKPPSLPTSKLYGLQLSTLRYPCQNLTLATQAPTLLRYPHHPSYLLDSSKGFWLLLIMKKKNFLNEISSIYWKPTLKGKLLYRLC